MIEKLKLIFCTDGIFPHSVGGMQRHSLLLIEELAAREYIEIVVIHPHKEIKAFANFSNVKEIGLDGIDLKKNYLIECYKYSKRVYKEVLNFPNHIIYSQGLSIWHNIKKVSNRLVINPHGLEAYQAITFKDKLTTLPFKLIFNYLFNHSRYVVSLGGLLTNILKKNITNKKTQIVVLSNGVIIPLRFQNAEVKNQDVLNLLFVGRFASNKGIHILLEVIKELNDSGYEDKIVYNLAGKGPLWSHYSDNFKFKNVKYLGFVSDAQLLDLYTKNDLFILPTLFEGMPTVVLEAMSYSLPIIVTEVGATSELVNSSNGFLIKKNDVKALKEAIVTFYNLPKSEKAALGKGSLQIAKNNFTWEIVANKHIELFTFIKDAIH